MTGALPNICILGEVADVVVQEQTLLAAGYFCSYA
jgi:hypothetical protein